MYLLVTARTILETTAMRNPGTSKITHARAAQNA